MLKFKKGDIVSRNSYDNDVLFMIERIIKVSKNRKIAILKGLTIRIKADAPLQDLVIVNKLDIKKSMEKLENRIMDRIKLLNNMERNKVYYGKILHLDGDKKYSEKSNRYYKSLGLNAIVKNIPENKQPQSIQLLLNRYLPDILVVTGHDGMIKNGTGFNNIYNYRNSKYFIQSVQQARNWGKGSRLMIFAGACQSYYEALIHAGANFASSPARILIDFIDPLIVAEKISMTDESRFVSIRDIERDLRDGQKGVSGVGSYGKKRIL